MGTTSRNVADVLREAMQVEINGYHFYTMAAGTTTDPQGRQVFEDLAQEELGHLRYLRRQYGSVQQTGRPDPDINLRRRSDWKDDSPIFSAQLRERVGDAHFEMSALSIGVQLELSAIRFYKAQAAATSDPTLRKVFQDLAQWESGHYHALLRQQEELKEDYWSAGGFSPL